MGPVEQAIATEDAQVTSGGHRYVSVALLGPFTYSAAGDVSLPRMVDEMRGAYLAQEQANATGVLGVQLLLVNEGTSNEELDAQAVQQIESVQGRDRIVAVANMGLSTAATGWAATALARDGMPMFAPLTSADQFNGHNYAGFDQVTPDVRDQVEVMSTALKVPRDAILVQDQQENDDYTTDLHTDFEEFFGQTRDLHLYPYTPHASEITSAQFAVIAADECFTTGQPPVVFYAGRSAVLAPLIQQFQQASDCAGKDITILSAADADGLDRAVTKSPPSASGGQVSVEYTDTVNVNRLTPQYQAAYQQYLGTVDKAQDGLADPWAIHSYNAMMAAWSAISYLHERSPDSLLTRTEVAGMTGLLNGRLAPTGATGTFDLSAYGQLLSPDVPIFEDVNGTRITVKP
jgi:hypothetical protein